MWITPLTVAYRAEDVKKEKPRLCRDLTRSSSINAVLPPWHFEYVLATSICVKVQTVWLWTKTDLLKYFTQIRLSGYHDNAERQPYPDGGLFRLLRRWARVGLA